jgi:AcrR family transcriptional regulator
MSEGQRGATSSDAVASDQRERLQAAMVELVVRRGYQETSITDITGLAHVSRTSFYEHFSGKEQCFLDTYEEVLARSMEAIAETDRRSDPWDERLRVLLETFVAFMLGDPLAAHFLLVSALGTGPDALERRDQLMAGFLLRVRHSYDEAPDGVEVPDFLVRAIVGGIAGVAYFRLRQGRIDELPASVDDFVAWGRAYRHAALVQLPSSPSGRFDRDPRQEPPPAATLRRARGTLRSLPRSFVAGDQRERIVLAAAVVVAERGYTRVTIPQICRTAGVSHQTFYELFPDKAQALRASYEAMGERLFSAISAVFTPIHTSRARWPAAVRAAMEALTAFFAGEPAFARAIFVESLVAGADVGDVREQYTNLTAGLILSGGDELPGSSPVVTEAIAGAIFELLHHEVCRGRTARLSELVPHLTFIALAPYIGAVSAVKVAVAPPSAD